MWINSTSPTGFNIGPLSPEPRILSSLLTLHRPKDVLQDPEAQHGQVSCEGTDIVVQYSAACSECSLGCIPTIHLTGFDSRVESTAQAPTRLKDRASKIVTAYRY